MADDKIATATRNGKIEGIEEERLRQEGLRHQEEARHKAELEKEQSKHRVELKQKDAELEQKDAELEKLRQLLKANGIQS